MQVTLVNGLAHIEKPTINGVHMNINETLKRDTKSQE